jgi:hypothetical protein
MLLAGTYYPPGSSRAFEVALRLDETALQVSGEGVERVERLDDCPLSEPLGRMARHFTLPDGARIEVVDLEELAAWETQQRRSSGRLGAVPDRADGRALPLGAAGGCPSARPETAA